MLVYAVGIEPFFIKVSHVQLEDVDLNRVLKGKTAIHISDLHISSIGRLENQVLQKINDSKPDFVFLTGDYVQWNGSYEPALEFLAKLQAEIGVWAVMGDYDYSNDRKNCFLVRVHGVE